jgi:hypothetical protein
VRNTHVRPAVRKGGAVRQLDIDWVSSVTTQVQHLGGRRRLPLRSELLEVSDHRSPLASQRGLDTARRAEGMRMVGQ